MECLEAVALDAPDGLTRQFRLPLHVSQLPPAAVETIHVDFMYVASESSEARLRLRLHSPSQAHDYSFRLAVEYLPAASESTKKGVEDDSGAAPGAEAEVIPDKSK